MLWDVDFRCAVAQAELEDREMPGAYHRLPFIRTDTGEPVHIETTRPELLGACVALVAHPDDARYAPLFGSTVRTPLFGVEVEIRPHELADPEKGSGIAMICTFGDLTDVIWWRELQLETRSIVSIDGRIQSETPEWITAAGTEAVDAYREIAGKTVRQAQTRIVELLGERGLLDRWRSSPVASGTCATEVATSRCATRSSNADASCTGIHHTCESATRTG